MKILNIYVKEKIFVFWITALIFLSCQSTDPHKTHSVFFSNDVLKKIQSNVGSSSWGAEIKSQCLENAKPWLERSDEELWSAMFGATISRSWMVWSNGFCPACKESVPMYNWKSDPFNNPWKVQCPHCGENFPKNDFYAYYQSALDEHGVFDPALGDSSLLFNTEHPDKSDPLHKFGVDDGEGYVDGENRWRFIGEYLVKTQWKKFIYDGILKLSLAYLVSGDSVCAHKAGILLDRVADLYPSFDYNKQGYTYERQDPIVGQGYISVWHDACRETREMALAYDAIFDALKKDRALVQFLGNKASQFQLENSKSSFQLIQKNIEEGIFRDALENRHKIISNFPQTETTVAIIETILNWPARRGEVMDIIGEFIQRGVANDGLSGEQGLAGYAAIFPRSFAEFLSMYNQLEPGLLETLFEERPDIHQTFRFHIDTWVNESYYPRVGDTGVIAQKNENYVGATFTPKPLDGRSSMFAFTSMYSLFWKLYELTGDSAFVKILFKENDNSLEGLPFDMLCDNPAAFQSNVKKVIDAAGEKLRVASVNKEKWCIGLLRSGDGPDQRSVWLDYDVGGNHCHADGMNIGLFSKGLDLLPGFGYPPVQFGGWTSPRAIWYRKTAAHNTVVVDGADQIPNIGQRETEPLAVQLNPEKRLVRGKSTLWASGKKVQIIRASGPELYRNKNLKQYERTIALVDISEKDSYIVDVFRVIGGTDHAKFLHGYFGDLTTNGLSLSPIQNFGIEAQMRNFRGDSAPKEGWSATWDIRDVYNYLSEGQSASLRYLDFTRDASAMTAETWVAFGFSNSDEAWLPAVVVRNQSETGPASTAFVGLLEPFENTPKIESAERFDIFNGRGEKYSDMNIALQIDLADGTKDIVLAMDAENPLESKPSFSNEKIAALPDIGFETDAEFCLVRLSSEDQIEIVAVANGSFVRIGNFKLAFAECVNFAEVELQNEKPVVISGNNVKIKDFSF